MGLGRGASVRPVKEGRPIGPSGQVGRVPPGPKGPITEASPSSRTGFSVPLPGGGSGGACGGGSLVVLSAGGAARRPPTDRVRNPDRLRSGGQFVFVDEPAEKITAANTFSSVRESSWLRRSQVEAAMRSAAVVVLDVFGEDFLEVTPGDHERRQPLSRGRGTCARRRAGRASTAWSAPAPRSIHERPCRRRRSRARTERTSRTARQAPP
jgi:hypothetical protein